MSHKNKKLIGFLFKKKAVKKLSEFQIQLNKFKKESLKKLIEENSEPPILLSIDEAVQELGVTRKQFVKNLELVKR